MKTSALKFAIFFVTVMIFAGCAGHPPRHPNVVIRGGSNTVSPGQTITLTAVVTNDKSGAGVVWAVVGSGTFTSTNTTLTYTAPANVPENPVVMVTATTIATPTATETISFTLVGAGAVAVNITNPIATATAGSDTNIVLNAVVTNDVNAQGVTWQLVTAGTTTACAPGCGSIVTSTTTSFTYLPPSTVPANPSTSIIATSIADGTQSATDTFTIQAMAANNLMFLHGSYAFEASGFDPDGFALTLAGSFVSDGNGNIISSEIDVNDKSAISNTTSLTGTYTLDSNLRGVITFNDGFNGFSDSATLAFTIDSATNNGFIVSADEETPAVSGLLAGQSAAASTTPSGNFVMRGTSDAASIRAGMVGRLTVGAGGVISAGLLDSADIATGNDSIADVPLGTYATTDPAGRGTVNFNLDQSNLAGGNYAYYIVSPTEFFMVGIDNEAPGQFVIVARTQAALTANSVNGTGVFGLIGADDGADNATAPIASAAIGQLVITGGTTASIVCDVNDATDVTQCSTNGTTATPIPGTVTFDSTSGRGTLTIPDGFSNGFIDSATFYIEANGTGVLMDTTQPVGDSVPEALVGDWIPQTSTADIAGQVQGVGLTGDDNAFAIAGVFNISDDGAITGLFDGSSGGIPPVLDSSITGTAGNTDATGRTDLQVSGELFGGQNQPAGSFSASPNQYFVIVEAQEVETDLGIFTPQTLPAQAAVKATSNAKTNVTGAAAKLRSRHLNPAVAAKHQRRNAAKVHPETVTPRQHL